MTLPILSLAAARGNDPAILDGDQPVSYAELLGDAAAGSRRLREVAGEAPRVAFLVPPGHDYLRTLWSTWLIGGIGIPIALAHPAPEIAFTLEDSDATAVVVHPDLRKRLPDLDGRPLLTTEELPRGRGGVVGTVQAEPEDPALLLYTSGTTGRPKGVVLRHRHLQAQAEMLSDAWGWTAQDRILEILPLHHVHGLVNVVYCALWNGAVCEFLPRFDATAVWNRLASGEITLFMAVPTIYHRLIAAWEAAPDAERQRLSEGATGLRLMVSGSAALPVPVLERWREITGHTLLERYGMTEIGMALSNPLEGQRIAGSVGRPLPGVKLRLVDEEGRPVGDGEPGQIEVRGKTVFDNYWQRPEATSEAFRDSWFVTGDQAIRDEDGVYRILGRRSVDILKSGGEKISALEIENVLLTHPAIQECAVVGLPDPDWGQQVTAAVVLAEGQELDLDTLRPWAKERLATYKAPRALHVVDALPRNPLGKVTKPELVKRLSGE